MHSDMFTSSYGEVFDGDERWNSLAVPEGDRFAWAGESTYVRQPPFFDDLPREPEPVGDIEGARVLAVLGDSVTTDHISPAGAIKKDSPAARYLNEHGVENRDFNSYGSRRGNHEVMMRGTFANIRLRNTSAAGSSIGGTHALRGGGDADLRRGDEVRRAGHAAGGAGGGGVRLGLVARLGGQGHAAARRAGGDRASRTSASTARTWSAWACSRCSSRRATRSSRWG